MKTIRRNTFETNSSSAHCVTILSDKEYQNIKNGKAVIDTTLCVGCGVCSQLCRLGAL